MKKSVLLLLAVGSLGLATVACSSSSDEVGEKSSAQTSAQATWCQADCNIMFEYGEDQLEFNQSEWVSGSTKADLDRYCSEAYDRHKAEHIATYGSVHDNAYSVTNVRCRPVDPE